jgi:hypothetical protein
MLTAFCVFLIVQATRATTTQDALLRLLFLTMCLPGACYPLRFSLGTERLRIGPDGLDYQSHALIPLQERHVPLGEIKGINYRPEIETLGKPVRFGPGIEPGGNRWLADLLQRHLRALIPDRVITLQPVMGAIAKPTVPIEVLGPAGAIPEPPSDCAIRLKTESDRIEFLRSRASSLVSYGFNSLFLILSYGISSLLPIVGILLCGSLIVDVSAPLLEHQHFWPLLLFSRLCIVIPCILVNCVLLTIPFWGERWAFRPGEITARSSIFFGLGRLQRVEAESIARVELRKGACIRTGWVPRVYREQVEDARYSLGLVGQQGQDLLVIAALTEGEARWMGGRLCEQLRS